MGLLDGLFQTPSDQALWALGSGLLGVRRGNEGRAFMGAMGAYNDAQQEQRRNALVDLQRQQIEGSMAERKAKAAQEAEALLRRQQFLSQLPARLNMPLPGGPTIANAQAQGKPTPALLAEGYGLGFKPDDINALAGREEIKHWEKTPGANGPEITGFTKYGATTPTGQRAWIADLDPAVQTALDRRASLGASKNLQLVNAFEPFSVQLQKDMAKNLATTQDMLKDAPATLLNIEKAKSLVSQSNPFIGSFGDKKLEIAKFFNNNFGTSIAPGAVADAETLRTSLFMQIMDNLKKMDAQPSQMQQIMMKDALGNLNTDPSAIGRVLDVLGETLRNKVSAHNKRVGEFTTKNPNALPYDLTIELPTIPAPAPASPGGVRYVGPATK